MAARDRWMSADEHDKAVRRIAALRHHAEDSSTQILVDELAMQVATSLASFAGAGRYDEITTILRGTVTDVEDNVASHLIELLTTPQLEQAALDPSGNTMPDVCYDALITGTVTTFENLQGDRILAARVKGGDIGRGEVEKVLQNPTVFPLETSWDSSATIVASLEADRTVKVYYDTRIGAGRPKYTKEMATLTARFGVSAVYSGMILKPDEIVTVKLYDQDEAMVPVPAIKLIDLANRQLQDFEGKFEKVTILGAALGLGAVGGAGALGTLDTAAFTISTASIFIDAYRSDIAKTAGVGHSSRRGTSCRASPICTAGPGWAPTGCICFGPRWRRCCGTGEPNRSRDCPTPSGRPYVWGSGKPRTGSAAWKRPRPLRQKNSGTANRRYPADTGPVHLGEGASWRTSRRRRRFRCSA